MSKQQSNVGRGCGLPVTDLFMWVVIIMVTASLLYTCSSRNDLSPQDLHAKIVEIWGEEIASAKRGDLLVYQDKDGFSHPLFLRAVSETINITRPELAPNNSWYHKDEFKKRYSEVRVIHRDDPEYSEMAVKFLNEMFKIPEDIK